MFVKCLKIRPLYVIPGRKRNEINSTNKTAQGLQNWLASDYKFSLILSNLDECSRYSRGHTYLNCVLFIEFA